MGKIWRCNWCGKEEPWGPTWLSYGGLDDDGADHVVCSLVCAKEYSHNHGIPFNLLDEVVDAPKGRKKSEPSLPGFERTPKSERTPVELKITAKGINLRLYDKKAAKTPDEANRKIVELWTSLRTLVDAALAAMNKEAES